MPVTLAYRYLGHPCPSHTSLACIVERVLVDSTGKGLVAGCLLLKGDELFEGEGGGGREDSCSTEESVRSLKMFDNGSRGFQATNYEDYTSSASSI